MVSARRMARYTARAATALVIGSAAGIALAAGAEDAKDDEAPRAFKPAVNYNGVAFGNLRGGVQRGGTYSSNLNLSLTVDGGALAGWRDTTGYADVLWLQGGLPSNFVGDAQGVSSISAPNIVKLYEAWVQRGFLDDRISVLAGLYDLNSEFYRLQTAGLFFNSSFGIGPEFSQSGLEGSSIFPDTSIGVRGELRLRDGVVLRAAVLDGVPLDRPNGSRGAFEGGDGVLLVAELDLIGRPPEDTGAAKRPYLGRAGMRVPYDTKLALGAWHYTATFDDLSETQANGQPVRHRGSSGFYLLGDRVLWRDPEAPDRQVAAFVQAGYGDRYVDRFGAYVGGGLTATGLVRGRPDDQVGIAFAYARNGSHYVAAQRAQDLPVTNAETAIEATYLWQVNGWLALQPDLQYVIRPNTTTAIPNALAFQLRIEVAF
jgi:porin